MSRDGTGVMSVSYPDFQSGAIISDSEMDANFADIVTELTNSLPRDGQAAPTANIPFGTYKITGLGAGAAATDSANLGQVQAQAYIWCATATGSKNALALTPSPPITAYADGQAFRFKSGTTASDDAVTVAVSGLATKAIQSAGAALSASVYIEANQWYEIVYDGAAFQLTKIALQDLSAYAPLASPTFTGTVQIANLTVSALSSLATTSISYLSVTQLAQLATTSVSVLTATSIGSAGTGLTGTAAALSIGGTAAALSTASGSAPSYAARAWCVLNGNGTPAIVIAKNFTATVVDNGAGDYTLNFDTAIEDADYAVCGSGGTSGGFVRISSKSSTQLRIIHTVGTTPTDDDKISVIVFR